MSRVLSCVPRTLAETPLFTENETNYRRLYGVDHPSPYVKDGIHEAIIRKNNDGVNPSNIGTKAAAHYPLTVRPAETVQVRLRLTNVDFLLAGNRPFGNTFDAIFDDRLREANEFYSTV